MREKISFTEELLSGFLDGELSKEDAERVSRFALSSANIREDLGNLSQCSELFRSNFMIAPRELNTWEAIQNRLEIKSQASKDATIEPVIIGDSVLSRIFRILLRPGYGAALALGLFVVGMISSQWTELPSSKEAMISNVVQEDLPIDHQEVLVPLLQNGGGAGDGQTFVSNGGAPGVINGFDYSPQFISPQQLGTEHPSRGAGLREDGVQIDWMKNSRSVRFLRPKDQSSPPIIWLGDLR